jgi:hypothetical protein
MILCYCLLHCIPEQQLPCAADVYSNSAAFNAALLAAAPPAAAVTAAGVASSAVTTVALTPSQPDTTTTTLDDTLAAPSVTGKYKSLLYSLHHYCITLLLVVLHAKATLKLQQLW